MEECKDKSLMRHRKSGVFQKLFSPEAKLPKTDSIPENDEVPLTRDIVVDPSMDRKRRPWHKSSDNNVAISPDTSSPNQALRERYSRRSKSICVTHQVMANDRRSSMPTNQQDDYDDDLSADMQTMSIEDRLKCLDFEKQIMKAKSEAKTVTIIDGQLYIDYQYVQPVPVGAKM